LRIRRTFLENS